MEVELLSFLVCKAYKIFLYEQQPRTDEQYFRRKKALEERYKGAKKNYLLTSDPKYKKEMSRLKKFLSYIVSKTEYELSKELLKKYKSSYSKVIDERYWTYDCLSCIEVKIICGEADSVERAVQIYKSEREGIY